MTTDTILLIEDNQSDIELARRAFRKVVPEVELIVAEDGQDALDYLLGEGGPADGVRSRLPALTLLDLKLPRISGLEVLRRLRLDDRTRRMPIVVLTSSSQDEDIAACYDLGANSYVRKPVDFRLFVDSVGQMSRYWLQVNEPPPSR